MNTRNEIIKKCELAATQMRINALKLALQAGSNGAHLGGGLSIIEIMATLYCGLMNMKSDDPKWKSRDRFILSKGDGTLAYYAALEAAGIITKDQLFTYDQNGGPLLGTSAFNPDIGIEYSSGTLGLGLSYAVGLALASVKSGIPYGVFVLLGDGECNEGSIWEAIMSAQHFKLSNLTAVVDLNSMQSDGKTCDVLNIQLEKMWKGFGWEVIIVDDGHNIAQLFDAFTLPIIEQKPRVIIAHTIKGKGVSFMENNNEWHYNRLSKDLFDAAIKEITGKES
jgi:transketolase